MKLKSGDQPVVQRHTDNSMPHEKYRDAMYAGTVELTCVYTLTVSNGVPWNLTVVIVSSQKFFRSYSD